MMSLVVFKSITTCLNRLYSHLFSEIKQEKSKCYRQTGSIGAQRCVFSQREHGHNMCADTICAWTQVTRCRAPNKHQPGGGLKYLTFGRAEVSRWRAFRVRGTLSTTYYSPEGRGWQITSISWLHLLNPEQEQRTQTCKATQEHLVSLMEKYIKGEWAELLIVWSPPPRATTSLQILHCTHAKLYSKLGETMSRSCD